MMTSLFAPTLKQPDRDGERVCGACEQSKSVDEFYKDGTDSDGAPKYRRDCKECYRVTRLSSRKKKRVPIIDATAKPKPRTARSRRK